MDPETDVFGTQTSAAAMAFGIRGVVDWSVQQPFLDVFKTAQPWHAHSDGQWGVYVGAQLDDLGVLDENGWITEMPSGIESIQTFILTEMPAEAENTAGLYRLTYDGRGDISVSGARIVSQNEGEIWFDHTPTGDGMVTISISSTDPQNTGDNLRNIEVVKQEYIPAHEAGEIFNPLWLDVVDDVHALRYMDWQETNNSTMRSWNEVPTADQYTYQGGVPLEVMVELANATGTEPCFNIPWHADETFIREFATYVRDTLNPDLRAHFEMSNEVWNWMFDQTHDAAEAALARFGGEVEAGWMQEYGARSAEMARVLDDVYSGAEDQLVKVISTHTYWPGLENAALDAPDWQAQSSANAAPYLSFDTYAITGYFGNSLGTDEKANVVLGWIADSEAAARQTASAQGLNGAAADAYFAQHRYDLAVDLAVRELRDGSVTGNSEDSLQGLFELFRYHKSVADAHGLDLVMYEGGTHVVGVGAWVNNDALTDFFTHLNYSDGMGTLYAELLDGWEAAGGTLFNAFVDLSEPTKWGSWGSLRHLDDTNARHDAVVAFIEAHPAPDHMKDGIWSSQPHGYDTPPSPDPGPEPDPQPQPQPEPRTDPEPPIALEPRPLPNPNPVEPTNDVREYMFGNSLLAWANGTPEHSIAHWMTLLADASGTSYAAGIQTGMLTQHDDLPARPHIEIDGVSQAWDSDSGASFASANFNHVTISPVNFVQDQSPDSPYWIAPETSPLDSALTVMDWVHQQAPGATINIVETWPEMEGFMSSFPPSAAEFAAWRGYLEGDWHAWWVSLVDMIREARPDMVVRHVDVGPQLMAMLDDSDLGLSSLRVSDLFQDDAPHGTPTLNFLVSVIHYTALYGTPPTDNFDLPDSVHPAVADNIGQIIAWVEEAADARLPTPLVNPFEDTAAGLSDGSNPTVPDGTGSNADDRIDASLAREIDGRGGTDTVFLDGHQATHTVRFDGDTVVIEDRSTGAAATTMRNVERLDFETDLPIFSASGMDLRMFDGMADLSMASMEILTELYIAYFNRAPDAIGLYFWGDQMAQGLSIEQIAEAFFEQPETQALYGTLEDMPQFVTSVYQNVLGRDPDDEGMTYWLDVLESGSGVTPATFIQAMLAGAKAPTGGSGDAEYLAHKVALGGHFAVTRGMSDVEDANLVMQSFNGTEDSLAASLMQTDAMYDSIASGQADGFLLELVGIGNDAFMF